MKKQGEEEPKKKTKKKKKKSKKYKTFSEWLRKVKREEARWAKNLALDAEIIREAIRTAHDALAGPAGRISRTVFGPWRARIQHDGRERQKIDALCENLQRLVWKYQKAATDASRAVLRAGGKPNIAELLKPARQLSVLYDLFDLARSATEGDRAEVYGAEVARQDDEPTIKLSWMRRWPDHLSGKPLLILDATAEPTISRLPFAARIEGMELDASDKDDNVYVDYHKIKVQAPHQILMKVIGAKTGKKRFDNVATELVEENGKRTRRLKTEKGEDSKEFVPRMRGDSHWAEVLRVPYAVAGRALGMGQKAGFNSYKLVIDYIKKTGTLQEAIVCNWPGLLRGSNSQENVDVLINECALMLHEPDLEREAEKIFAMDPKARLVQRGLQMQWKPPGLRVNGGGGIEIDTPVHPCDQVQMVFEYKTVAEEAQINGRARGIRRSDRNPVLIISVNDIVDDNTYDIVVHYDAFASMDDMGAALHAQGIISSHAPHQHAMARELFEDERAAWRAICSVWTVNETRNAVSCPDFTYPLLGDPPIRDSENPGKKLRCIVLGPDNTFFGTPCEHPLLALPAIKFTTYRPEGFKRDIDCAIDTNRPLEQLRAMLEARIGRKVLEIDGQYFDPPKAPRRRGPKPSGKAKSSTERSQEHRARLKAEKAAKPAAEAQKKTEAPKPKKSTNGATNVSHQNPRADQQQQLEAHPVRTPPPTNGYRKGWRMKVATSTKTERN
jgi:hypothetical protein